MRKPIAFFSLILALSTPGFQPSHAAIVYRQGEGWSTSAEDSGPAEATASAQYRKAENLEAQGELKKALGAYKVLVREWPYSGAGPKAQMRIGDLYLKLGDPEKAFDAYAQYLARYPSGEDFEKAVEAQFKIAISFLEGERRKVFGVKMFPSMERAQEMFTQIVRDAPYSKWAALAQFNIGRSLEKQTKYDEAVVAYQEVVERYPADEIAADAQYQIAYIYFSQARAGSNDQNARNRAREAYEDFLMRYPNSEKVAQAQDNLALLNGTDLKKTLEVGQFYEKTKNYRAAVIYYNDVIGIDPNSPEAKVAKKRLDHLRETVGDDRLKSGLERAETGARAKERRKLQALVDVSSRPDYVGPPAPKVPDEEPPAKPQFRGSTLPVEPVLPGGADPAAGGGLPLAPDVVAPPVP